MTEPDEQTEVRAAWLYFMEGLTQAEIAHQLGTTRLRINRILIEARRNGLVGVTLNSKLASCVALEQELARDFRLRAAVIVPTPADGQLIPVLLGRAAGEYISQFLEQNRITGLGIGWGTTLREVIRHVRTGHYPHLCVNSLMGGLTHGLELNTFDIASELAQRLSAECQYFAAPIYAGSPESRDIILAQDVFRNVLRRIAANDIAILSIGALLEGSLFVRYGLPQNASVEDLRSAGAACEIMGQFLDDRGRPLDHWLNRSAIALPLEALWRIPTVVFVSGGRAKTHAIASVLRAGIAAVLVCDEETARAAAHLARGNSKYRSSRSTRRGAAR